MPYVLAPKGSYIRTPKGSSGWSSTCVAYVFKTVPSTQLRASHPVVYSWDSLVAKPSRAHDFGLIR